MKAYKGMDKNMRCRGYQFEIGKTYEEPEAVLCRKGFHACTEPLDVFKYYDPGTSRYFEVELDGVTDQSEGDSKIAARKITIVRELTIDDIIDAQQSIKQSTMGGDGSVMQGGVWSVMRGGYGSVMQGGAGSAMRGGDGSVMRGGYGSVMQGGYESVMLGGESAKARGGMWSVLAFERWIDGEFKGVACGVVDGVSLKPDTWYHLNEIGEFEEVDGDDK